MRFTSRPKGRWDSRRAATACSTDCDFTTSYHTQFPQYLRSRFPIPTSLSYRALRWFHGAATHCMVSTQTVRNQLAERGFRNLVHWQRGVDTQLFRPGAEGFSAASTADCGLRRARGDREEHRCVPAHALGGHEARDRRWTGAAAIEGAVPGRRVRGIPVRRRPRAASRGVGRVRVPEPHRHFRSREPRSHGVWSARGGVPGGRADRCRRGRRHGCTG